eukprot:scaffold2836_cov99-Cylindrotheca_fusiformis.AAC.7
MEEDSSAAMPFDPEVKSTHNDDSEMADTTNPHGLRKFLDSVRMTSTRRFCTSIFPSIETKLCDIPKRKSSAQTLDYKTASDISSDFFTESAYDYYDDRLHGSIITGSSMGSLNPDILEESPTGFRRRGSTYSRRTSTESMVLGNIFEPDSSQDVSPVVAKRYSSTSFDSISTGFRRSSVPFAD